MDKWQLARFLTLVDGDRYRAPLLFLAMTGCRRGEALGLRCNDVDLDERVVRIRQQLTSVGHVVAIKPRTKSDKPRVVELDGVTIAMLKTWRAQQSQERLLMGPGYDDGGLVFCHADGRRYDPEKFSRAFARILAKRAFAIELPRIRLHDLRHTWATLALVAGVDVKVTSERLGHSSPVITWTIYQHVVKGMQRDAADKVAALVFGDQ